MAAFLSTPESLLLPLDMIQQSNIVRFLGHDAYSACKHCASGYVLSFSFVYILTISLYASIFLMHLFYMYTIHAPHELA